MRFSVRPAIPVCVVALAWSQTASAEDGDLEMVPPPSVVWPTVAPRLLPPRLLVVRPARRCCCDLLPAGLYAGVDAGRSLLLAEGSAPALGAWGFGLHAGYRLPSGVAFDLRVDDLGVALPAGSLRAGGLGMAYTFPRAGLRPFAEVHLGAETMGGIATLAGDAGLGLAVPVGDHVEVNLAARDWIARVDGPVRHVPMFTVGLVVGFDRAR